MKDIIISIVLVYVAISIFLIVMPFGLFYQIIKLFDKNQKSIYLSDYFFYYLSSSAYLTMR